MSIHHDVAPQRWSRQVGVMLGAVAAHPSLWWASVTTLIRLARRGWWHRPPFLPVPGDRYWHFRLVTAFGGSGEEAALSRGDVVAYLQWCRRTRPPRG